MEKEEEIRQVLIALRSEVAALRREIGHSVTRQAFTKKEAAESLGISTTTLSRLIATGLVLTVPVGGHSRIPASEVERIAREGADSKPQPPAAGKSGSAGASRVRAALKR